MSEWLEGTALGLRGVILCLQMVVAALAIVNAIAFARHHRSGADRMKRLRMALKASAVTVYGCGAFYGTYTRIDREFTWSLPPMALGLAMYAAYLFCEGESDPKVTADQERLKRLVG